jgi:hypothetical protein
MKIISETQTALRTATPPPAAEGAGTVVEYNAPFHPGDGGHVRSRRAFVIFSITLSVLIVLAAMASIYRRWYKLRLPTSYIHLVGDETTANAEVTVLLDRREVARVKLEQAQKYEKPVLVEPGLYTVEARMGGHLMVVHRFYLPDNARGVQIPITLRVEADAAAGLPPGTRAYQAVTRPAPPAGR